MAVRDSRSLEKSLFSPGSRRFFRLKNDQVRLLFIGLVLVADDLGRLEGDADDLVAMFPKMNISTATMTEHIKDMAAADLITQYKAGGLKYIEINNFVEHQNWNGISARGSKIPSNPKSVASTSRSVQPMVAEFLEITATTPKSIPCFTNTYTEETNATAATATNQGDETYRECKRIFRTKVGKSIGSLSNRVSQWEGLVNKHGSDRIVKAVEIWATEMGKGGRNLAWPLAVFLKNADEFIEAAANQQQETRVAQSQKELIAETIAADDEAIRIKKEKRAVEKNEEQRLIELTRGAIC